MQPDWTLSIATSADPTESPHWQSGTKTWAEFCGWVADPDLEPVKEDGAGYVLGRLDKGRRKKETILTRCALSLDSDYAMPDLPDQVKGLGVASAMHTTWHHTPEKPRYRIILPLDRPVTQDEYTRLAGIMMDRLGRDGREGKPQFDPCSLEPSRFMYVPSCDPARRDEYDYQVLGGEPLSVAGVFVETTPPAPSEAAEEPNDPPVGVLPPTRSFTDDEIRAEVTEALSRMDSLAGLGPTPDTLPWPGAKPDGKVGWDLGYYLAAQRLVWASNAGGYYIPEQAEADFFEHAPPKEGTYDPQHKWDSAVKDTGSGTFPASLPSDDFDVVTDPPPAVAGERFRTGGSFILDAPTYVPAIWGQGDQVLWPEGEALTICGPPGVGKTTIGGQLVRARLGLSIGVLGYPVKATEGKVLYLAMDRPQQIARALRRHFQDVDRAVLDEHLVIWEGPPLQDLAKHPNELLRLCRRAGANTVIIDSLKDAAIGLSDDETGAGYNRARQICLVNGIEVLEMHHMTKKNSAGGPPTSLEDLYGSAWIAAGAGSVVLLSGKAGDPIVDLHHLKQPAAEVGPFKILHDAETGTSTVFHSADLLAFASGKDGVTAKEAAMVLYDTTKPSPAEVQKARRKLENLVTAGRLDCVAGDKTQNRATVWTITGTITGGV